jgi:hypothetical protein
MRSIVVSAPSSLALGFGSMKPTFFATPAEFRAWLEEHHATRTELLVGRSLGDEAYTIRFTPRKPRRRFSRRRRPGTAARRSIGW